jgi:hypothetical protein
MISEDVDFGVPEEPEEVLPEDGGTARQRVEEVRTQISVKEQHDLPRRQGRQRVQDLHHRHQRQPYEERHPPEGHARAAHREDGGHEVDRARHAPEAAHQQT